MRYDASNIKGENAICNGLCPPTNEASNIILEIYKIEDKNGRNKKYQIKFYKFFKIYYNKK